MKTYKVIRGIALSLSGGKNQHWEIGETLKTTDLPQQYRRSAIEGWLEVEAIREID